MELLSSSILPEDEEWSKGGEEAVVLEKCSKEISGPKEFLFLERMVGSLVSKAGGGDWLKTEVVATGVCTVTSSESPVPTSSEPRDGPLFV